MKPTAEQLYQARKKQVLAMFRGFDDLIALSYKQVAEETGLSYSVVWRLLDRMDDEGLLCGEHDGYDRREVRWSLLNWPEEEEDPSFEQ